MTLTYSSYLKLEELLHIQAPLSEGPEHDELLFIVIHQVYELWFKQILHETDYLYHLLREKDSPRAAHTLKRILTILKTVVGQLDILETMTPVEFLTFRDRLESSSGFESFQFRELEFALGHKRQSVMVHHSADSEAYQRLDARYQKPTIWDAFLYYLADHGYPVPQDLLNRDVTQATEPSTAVQEILIDIYHNNPAITQLCELMVDLDEGIQEWRYRHVKMVERTIGRKKGTGGSAGVKYLKNTLFQHMFPDLWLIRTEL